MEWTPESFAKRALVLVMIAGGGALSAGAFALPPAGDSAKMDCAAMHGKHGQKNQAERMEQRAKHLAALKAKLNLTAQQEAEWNAFTASRKGPMHTMGDRQAS